MRTPTPVAAVVKRRLTSPHARPAQRISRALTSAATEIWLLLALTASAQPFSLDWWTTDGGGGTSTGGVFTVTVTIGQPDAGVLSGGEFTLEGGFWGLIAAIQTPGAPRLSITNASDAVVVYWPLSAEGFVLEHTNRLTGVPGPWPQVPFPYLTNAPNVFIRVTAPGGNRFYRLHKP